MNHLNAIIKRDIRKFKNNKTIDFIISLTLTVNSLWNYLKRIRDPFTPISLSTDIGYKASTLETWNIIWSISTVKWSIQYRNIGQVDHIVSTFFHPWGCQINWTNPLRKSLLCSNIFPIKKPLGMMGLIQPSKISQFSIMFIFAFWCIQFLTFNIFLLTGKNQ